eukprot:CFRG4682T1
MKATSTHGRSLSTGHQRVQPESPSLPCKCPRNELGIRVYDHEVQSEGKGCGLAKYIETDLKILKASLMSSWANTGDMIQMHVCDTVLPTILETTFIVSKCAAVFDFSYVSPGNGYRSLLRVVYSCLCVLSECLVYCQEKRAQGILFNASSTAQVLSEYTAVLDTLGELLDIAVCVLRTSTCHSVFGVVDPSLVVKLRSLRKDHFYGFSFGFQFLPSMRRHLKIVITAMAALSSVYNKIESNRQKRTDTSVKDQTAEGSSVHRQIDTNTAQPSVYSTNIALFPPSPTPPTDRLSKSIESTKLSKTSGSSNISMSAPNTPTLKSDSGDGRGRISGRRAGMDVLRPDTVYENLKFMMKEDARGIQLQKQLEKGDVGFLRYFWNITESEVATQLSNVFSPRPLVNTVLNIPAKPITVRRYRSQSSVDEKQANHIKVEQSLSREDDDWVTISPAQTSFSHVKVRVLCYNYHEGQTFQTLADEFHDLTFASATLPEVLASKPTSEGLLFHIHGGGFVSQSSQSHELYLRHWAYHLGIPIVSVDYSLAPEAPYPQALEECLQAYAWTLSNAARLGTSAKTICLAGDSAGGNLVTALCLKTISLGIRRPDALMPVYPALTLSLDIPAPSRLLSVMDPLISFGALTTCFDAYLGTNVNSTSVSGDVDMNAGVGVCEGSGESAGYHSAKQHSVVSIQSQAQTLSQCKTKNVNDSQQARKRADPFLSPGMAPTSLLRSLPPVYLIAAMFDPLLDCAVDFAHKLNRLGNDVSLTVCPNVSHGFLAFATRGSGDEIADAAQVCDRVLQRVFAADYAVAFKEKQIANAKNETKLFSGGWGEVVEGEHKQQPVDDEPKLTSTCSADKRAYNTNELVNSPEHYQEVQRQSLTHAPRNASTNSHLSEDTLTSMTTTRSLQQRANQVQLLAPAPTFDCDTYVDTRRYTSNTTQMQTHNTQSHIQVNNTSASISSIISTGRSSAAGPDSLTPMPTPTLTPAATPTPTDTPTGSPSYVRSGNRVSSGSSLSSPPEQLSADPTPTYPSSTIISYNTVTQYSVPTELTDTSTMVSQNTLSETVAEEEYPNTECDVLLAIISSLVKCDQESALQLARQRLDQLQRKRRHPTRTSAMIELMKSRQYDGKLGEETQSNYSNIM